MTTRADGGSAGVEAFYLARRAAWPYNREPTYIGARETHRDPVAELSVLVDELRREDRTGWSKRALADRTIVVAGLLHRLQAELLRLGAPPGRPVRESA
jgi:hypothetical protein